MLFACWAIVLAAHLWIGASAMAPLLAARDSLPSGPNATSDLWLRRAKINATTEEVQALLARVPRGEDVILVAPRIGRTALPPWPFLSYVAWPRRLWVYHCDEGVTQPYIVGAAPPSLPWLLYFDMRPPRALRRLGNAGRLRLANADPSVQWISYCSS